MESVSIDIVGLLTPIMNDALQQITGMITASFIIGVNSATISIDTLSCIETPPF